jgi:hypothetical protein
MRDGTSSPRGWPRRSSAAGLFTIALLVTTSVAHAQAPEPAVPTRSVSSADELAQTESSGVATPSEVRTGPTRPLTQAAASAESELRRPPSTDPATKLLMKAIGWEESPVQIYGWIQNSFTGNTDGTPRNLSNVTVFPDRLANQWEGNQYYLIVENVLEQSDEINLGFRVDTLFGNDWEFTKDLGLFDNAFKTNSFAGLDFPQIYGSLHLPWLTENGIDVKGGRFYSPAGFESPMAIYRPGLSVPNIFNYTVFTYFGMLSTVHYSDRVDLYAGTVNGPNRWIDFSYVWNALVGLKWSSPDGRTTITDFFRVGPDQLPYFPRADAQFPVEGFPPPPYMAGKRNVGYTQRPRYYSSSMISHRWIERLNEVFEGDFVIDVDSPGFGANGTPQTTYIFGFVHWLLYDINPKVMGFWRSEIFSDPSGAATGLADTYYEITLGFRYEPKPWLWIRPEARYDWVEKGHPYADGTRSSQLTLAFDVIILW